MKGLMPHMIKRDIIRYSSNECLLNFYTALKKGEMIYVCEPPVYVKSVGQRIKEKLGKDTNVIVKDRIIIMEYQKKN